ncbi:cytokinin riboside 5'-monophosphate phosphoribohydrolase LOG1 [Senna tora]|uniref:Cytokinin riboside 5'-monophosphate phosphoribohydrolase LOG1 n=1 Tax=Senna tora TaxID=362788 RepID=A0A834XBV5_9FABA|nr:cytokinin riboside 5'-monophosphate phosphoribohydrolase LOG1 [Senna tora]
MVYGGGSIGLMGSISQAVYDGARSVYGDPLQCRRRRQDTAAEAEATSKPPGAFSFRHKTIRKGGASTQSIVMENDLKPNIGIEFDTVEEVWKFWEWKNAPYRFKSEGERTRSLRNRRGCCVLPASSPPELVAVDGTCCSVAMKSPICVMDGVWKGGAPNARGG